MSSAGNRKHLLPLLRQAEKEGALVTLGAGGHYIVKFGGHRITIPQSPRNPRTFYNVRARLRQIGLCK